MTRRVEFSPEALADLLNLYDYIAERSGAERALMFVQRIETYCRSFATFPERGTRRDDIRLGLRIIGFRRQVTLAFHLERDVVVFDRILYGGRDIERVLD